MSIVLLCIIGPIISGQDPFSQDLSIRYSKPDASHWFGTDSLGRDIFTRICLGGRNTLYIAFQCTLITTVFGSIYGGISAFFDKADRFMMSFLDVIASIPGILIAIMIPLWFDSKSVFVVILAICLTGWCKMARLVRNLLKPLRKENYIIAAKDLRKSNFYIILRHLLPNSFPSIISRAILSIPEFIFYESFLGYLGIGVQPPETSWGSMISSAQHNFLFHPYTFIFSCLLLVLTIVSISWVGEAISDGYNVIITEDYIPKITNDVYREKFGENDLVSVRNLQVKYNDHVAIGNVSFNIRYGEILGLVGSSGCGKTTIAKVLSGMIHLYNGITSPNSLIYFRGKHINISSKNYTKQLNAKNGVSVIYQDAYSCLDPSMKIGNQLKECIRISDRISGKNLTERAIELLASVGLKENADFILKQYPHQLSGGIAQRVVIAMAIAVTPVLLICDEPTSSLDTITKKQISQLIKKIADERKISVLFISHDIETVRQISDRIIIMSDGSIQEEVMPEKIEFSDNPTTKELVDAARFEYKEKGDFHTQKTILRVQHLKYNYPSSTKCAVYDISFKLKRGETFGILGESGSGKTTLGRLISGHMRAAQNTIILEGEEINPQYIFQNALSAFDPRITIGESIIEGLSKISKAQKRMIQSKLMTSVGLNHSLLERFPRELSIGQCQRASIARVLSVNHSFIICDEPTSSLDTVNQKLILELLYDLIRNDKVTCIFISHDLNVVRFMSDRIAVMYKGSFLETAPAEVLFRKPLHPYTKALLSDTYIQQSLDAIENTGITTGCPYANNCEYCVEICKLQRPELKRIGKKTLEERHHFVACHLVDKEE